MARTLAHERYHLPELRDGLPCPRTRVEEDLFEDRACAFEQDRWDSHPLNPANANK
ncbi:hypothetical protein ACIQF6_17270 [Kitasatospora sp. NPDC092948]|uniref:hypothetical protein n=1 Tax=Kitasatospora sp. NPDC092948 TaxID=3364088 RepID=UPI00380A5C07